MYISVLKQGKSPLCLEGIFFLYLYTDAKKEACISRDRTGTKNCFFGPSLFLLGRLVYAALNPSPTADSCQQHTRLSITSSLLKWKKQKIMHLSFLICQSYPQMDLIIQCSAQIKFLSTPFIFPDAIGSCMKFFFSLYQYNKPLSAHLLPVQKILALLSEAQ